MTKKLYSMLIFSGLLTSCAGIQGHDRPGQVNEVSELTSWQAVQETTKFQILHIPANVVASGAQGTGQVIGQTVGHFTCNSVGSYLHDVKSIGVYPATAARVAAMWGQVRLNVWPTEKQQQDKQMYEKEERIIQEKIEAERKYAQAKAMLETYQKLKESETLLEDAGKEKLVAQNMTNDRLAREGLGSKETAQLEQLGKDLQQLADAERAERVRSGMPAEATTRDYAALERLKKLGTSEFIEHVRAEYDRRKKRLDAHIKEREEKETARLASEKLTAVALARAEQEKAAELVKNSSTTAAEKVLACITQKMNREQAKLEKCA